MKVVGFCVVLMHTRDNAIKRSYRIMRAELPPAAQLSRHNDLAIKEARRRFAAELGNHGYLSTCFKLWE